MIREISRYVESRREELVALLGRLVAARTENPPGNESLAAGVAREYMDAAGIPNETHEGQPGRANIIGRLGRGKPSLLIAAHLDVVPAGEGWDSDPFQMREEGGRLVGRGVSDNKGPMASLLLAGRFLRERAILNGELLLAGVADEERGSDWGLEWLLAKGLVDADAAIIPDHAAHMGEIDVAEKGALFLEVTSHGRQAHGSTPHLGVNAIWRMFEFLGRVRDLKLPGDAHPLLSAPTLNLGMIHGGSAPNIVPGRCSAHLDIRFLPGHTARQVQRIIEEVARGVERDFPDTRFDLKVSTAVEPHESPDHQVIARLQQAVREVTGREARPSGINGASVIKQLVQRGIPAVGIGPGDSAQAHMANESIEVQELLDFAKVLAVVAMTCLGGSLRPSSV